MIPSYAPTVQAKREPYDASVTAVASVSARVRRAARWRPLQRRTAMEAPPRGLHAAEWMLLLTSPAVAFFGLRVRPMAVMDIIDQAFYTAYAQHGPDLVERYGAAGYFWTRIGFTFPAHLCYLLAGGLGGFFAFRYVLALLAVIPAYLLLRRLAGRGAGAVAVAAILTCPVVLASWGSDYPDSAALSYLFAGIAWLVMPAATRRRRVGCITAAGCVFTLAVHCQVVVIPLVVAAVVGYVAAYARRDTARSVLVDLAILVGCAIGVTAVVVLIGQLWLGHWDIFTPTWNDVRVLRTPAQQRTWHSSNPRWALTVPYLLVPPVAVVGWLLLRMRRSTPRPERAVGIGAVVGLAAYAGMQFLGGTATLEYHVYSSMLWASITLTTAFLLVGICRSLLGRPRTAWLPAALVVLPPLAWSVARPEVSITWLPWAAVAAIGALTAFVIAAVPHRRIVSVAVPAVIALLGCLILTVARPAHPQLPGTVPPANMPGTVRVAHGRYDVTLGHPSAAEVDRYAVASELHTVVPEARYRGDQLMMWWQRRQWRTFNMVTAQYLWMPYSLVDLPRWTPPDAEKIRSIRPHTLLLLSTTGAEFPAAVRHLSAAGLQPRVVHRAVLRSHAVTVQVWVLSLTGFA